MAHSENLLGTIALRKCEVPNAKSQYSVCTIIALYKTGYSLGEGHFWPQGHSFNKLYKGPLGNTTNQISTL